jgi:hypothetical protein
VANKGGILNYEQQFYLSGIRVSGVTDIDGGFSIPDTPIDILGKGYTYSVRQGPIVGNFNISKYYIGEDVFLRYTGVEPMSGSINYGDQSFGFIDGYLTEYSLSAGIGQIPQANASVVVYGDLGGGISVSGDETHPPIQIPNQGSIKIDVDGYSSNRISDFQYTMRIDREPVYAIGEPFPIHIHRVMPIMKEVTFNLEVFDYEIDKISDFLIKPKHQDLSISFNNPINDNLIEKFTLDDATVVSQSIKSSVDDVLVVNLTYNAYINDSSKA